MVSCHMNLPDFYSSIRLYLLSCVSLSPNQGNEFIKYKAFASCIIVGMKMMVHIKKRNFNKPTAKLKRKYC